MMRARRPGWCRQCASVKPRTLRNAPPPRAIRKRAMIVFGVRADAIPGKSERCAPKQMSEVVGAMRRKPESQAPGSGRSKHPDGGTAGDDVNCWHADLPSLGREGGAYNQRPG